MKSYSDRGTIVIKKLKSNVTITLHLYMYNLLISYM